MKNQIIYKLTEKKQYKKIITTFKRVINEHGKLVLVINRDAYLK